MDEARRRVREALSLSVDDAASAELVDHLKLPATAARAIREYASLRKQAEADGKRASAGVELFVAFC